MNSDKHLKHILLIVLTFLLGIQTTFAKTDLAIHQTQSYFPLEHSQKTNSLKNDLLPNIGFSAWNSHKYSERDAHLLAEAGGKLNLLGKLDNFTSLKTWVNGLDDVVDANLITKLDGLDATYLSKLETDIASNSMGSSLKTLLKESPDDLDNIWKLLKDDPKYAFELSKTGGVRWEKWAQGNFFKIITKKGKDFEELICKVAFKNRSSAKYLELKNKFQIDFAKNLDDYEMFSQVQLKYNSAGDYFVADQVFVKYDAFGEIDDLIVLENKLSSTTAFSPNQTSALQSNSFTVRSNPIESGTNNGLFLNKNETLDFSNSQQWYKVYSDGNGSSISGIQKVN
jgi:hypothetical protein